MSSYPIHTIESAPVQSKPVLLQLQEAFGLIPNIAGAMAASPVLISGFVSLFERVHASSLTEPQIQTLLLTGLPNEAGLASLSTLARMLIEKRGHLAESDQRRFVEAGFSSEQILEVIAVVAASTITNYTGSVTRPPLETMFEEFAWHAPAP
jgi:hypothetical protein